MRVINNTPKILLIIILTVVTITSEAQGSGLDLAEIKIRNDSGGSITFYMQAYRNFFLNTRTGTRTMIGLDYAAI